MKKMQRDTSKKQTRLGEERNKQEALESILVNLLLQGDLYQF